MDPELYALASDPTVDVETLRSLAFYHPELWTVILQNPACYPELGAWIQEQSDYAAATAPHPVVDEQTQVYFSQEAPLHAPTTEETLSYVGAQPQVPSSQEQQLPAAPVPEAPVQPQASKKPVVTVLAAVATVALVAVVVAAAIGNLGGAGTATGIGVSREQGCQNMVDAIADYTATEPDVDGYFEDDYDLEDWDALMGDLLYGVGDVWGDMGRSVSKKMGNREVRAAWDDYANFLQRAADPSYWFSGDLTEESVYEMMEEEAMYLERLDTLCPNVVLPEGF